VPELVSVKATLKGVYPAVILLLKLAIVFGKAVLTFIVQFFESVPFELFTVRV
jgi:hypothetical protein